MGTAPNNDLAIVLTAKIINDLTYNIYESQCDVPADQIVKSASFYQIRGTIKATLDKYIHTYMQEFVSDKHELEIRRKGMPKEYFEDITRRRVLQFCQDIYDKELFYRWVYTNGDWYRNEMDMVSVLNIPAIQKASLETRDERLKEYDKPTSETTKE